VDVPFGIRGGVPLPGEGPPFNPEAQVLATADGHPRAVGYFSRLPAPTLAAIRRHAFYAGLLKAQNGNLGFSGSALLKAQNGNTGFSESAVLAAARLDARRIDIGWVIVWHQTTDIRNYLARTGFRFDYRADGAEVYRPVASTARR
jgi:hypothetical protein